MTESSDVSPPPRGRWAVLSRGLSRVRELWPVTRLGLFVAALAGAGLHYYGMQRLDLVWFVAALSAFAIVGLSTLLSLLGALRVRLSLRNRAEPPAAQARVTELAFDTGFRLTRLRFWPLLETQLRWQAPAGATLRLQRDAGQWEERVALAERGELRRVERRITVRDVLGLTAITLRHVEPVHWNVLPHRGALRDVPWLASLAGGDEYPHPMGVDAGDRLELRRYAPGDPARFIHWKGFARTGKLVVRVPERALSKSHRTAAYLVAGAPDEASAAAALAAMESGAFGADWVFGADGYAGLAETPADVEAAVRRSVQARDHGGSGLSGFVAEASDQGPAALMLFVPARAGAWEAAVLEAVRNSSYRPSVMIGVDTLREPERSRRWSRLLWMPQPPSGQHAPEVRALSGRLRQAGARVWIADRLSGRLLGTEQLSVLGPRSAAA